jgi:hypothetical protein
MADVSVGGAGRQAPEKAGRITQVQRLRQVRFSLVVDGLNKQK